MAWRHITMAPKDRWRDVTIRTDQEKIKPIKKAKFSEVVAMIAVLVMAASIGLMIAAGL